MWRGGAVLVCRSRGSFHIKRQCKSRRCIHGLSTRYVVVFVLSFFSAVFVNVGF